MLEQMFDEIDEDDLIDEFDVIEELDGPKASRPEEEVEEDEENPKGRRRSFMSYSDYDNELDNEEKRRLMEIGITDN